MGLEGGAVGYLGKGVTMVWIREYKGSYSYKRLLLAKACPPYSGPITPPIQ